MKRLLTFILALAFISCSIPEHRRNSIEFPTSSFLQINHRVFFKACKNEEEACKENSSLIKASGFVLAGRSSKRKEGAIGVTAGHACDLTDHKKSPHRSIIKVSMLGGAVYKANILKVYPDADICILRRCKSP